MGNASRAPNVTRRDGLGHRDEPAERAQLILDRLDRHAAPREFKTYVESGQADSCFGDRHEIAIMTACPVGKFSRR